MTRSQPLISACIIARDEEENIGECIDSLDGFASQVVVGDTGSADRTVHIARSRGATVLRLQWNHSFADARNAVLDAATGRWLLSIDCDERLRRERLDEMLARLADETLPEVLLVRIINTYATGRRLDRLAPRLFKRASGFRYVHAVHEQLDADGADAALSEITFEHQGYSSPGACEAKERRNLALAQTMGDATHGLHCVARAAMALQDWQIALDSCLKLVNSDCSPLLMLEGCAMGGGAALALSDRSAVDTFVALAQTVMPDAPDIRLLQLLSAGRDYLESVERHGVGTAGDFLRAPVVQHNPAAVQSWMNPNGADNTVEAGPVRAQATAEYGQSTQTDGEEGHSCLG